MGNSHYKSHLVAAQSGVKIRGFNAIASMNSISATNITGNALYGSSTASAPIVKAQSFMQIGVGNVEPAGTRRFILTSSFNTTASMIPVATLFAKTDLPSTNIKGSIVLGCGKIWSFTSAQSATSLAAV